MIIPKRIFLTRGVGRSKEKLTSFELALRDAKISQLNLVKVSSIVPPGCRIISRRAGLKHVHAGQVVFAVLAENASNERSRMLSAAVGVAVPKDNKKQYGYLSEHATFGRGKKETGDYAEDLAAYMLATTLGVPFDPDKNYDEKKDIWRISGKEVTTKNITKAARVDKNGFWTTVVSLAVFC